MLKQRTLYLDVAKGVGIILVVLGHMYHFFPYDGRVSRLIYSVHLPLFLVIGGYWMTVKAEESPREFVRKKFDRLVKPYFIFCMISIFLYWPDSSAVTSSYIAGMFFANGVSEHLEFNLPLWYLPFFFMGNCAFYLILRFSVRFSEIRKRMMAELLLTLFLIGSGYFIRQHYPRLPWSAELALMVQGLFLFGHWWKLLEDRIKKKWFWLLIPAACFLWVLGVKTNVRIDLNASSFGSMPLFYLTTITGAFLLLMISKGLTHVIGIRSLLALCGKNSLYIMAYHLPACLIVQEVILGYMPVWVQQNYNYKNPIGIGYQLISNIAVCLFVALLHKKAER